MANGPVSLPRSSNRTCGFLASGFPTDFTAGPRRRRVLSKLRAKGLVEKLPHSRRYRLLPEGYSICLIFLKLFERIYAPLTAGLLSPVEPTPSFPAKTDRSSTASINASLMTLTRSSALSA